jgi:3-dehydroquinate synthase
MPTGKDERMILPFHASITLSSSILIEDHLLHPKINEYAKADTLWFVDEGIPTSIIKLIQDLVPPHRVYVMPGGEQAKEVSLFTTLIQWLSTLDVSPSTTLVAIGGGAVLDAVSFLASLYQRGLPLVLMPTTLLAMVDASIGGKTALNTKAKNQLGTFYPASTIIIDPQLVTSMPASLIQEGMSEVIKIALITDDDFVEALRLKSWSWTDIITKAIQLKLKLVTEDLQDKGVRRLLNFGHTFGHALEASLNFKVPHGVCVAHGMLLETRQSPFHDTVRQLLSQYDCLLPLTYDTNAILGLLSNDKKRHGKMIDIVVLVAIGKGEITTIPLTALKERL